MEIPHLSPKGEGKCCFVWTSNSVVERLQYQIFCHIFRDHLHRSSKAADNLINRTTKRAMRITYNSDSEETLEALLQRDGTVTIHKRNLQKLMVEVYKTLNHLNPPYMWDLFTKKVMEYDFRIKILCKLLPARSQRFGTNSLKFKGSLL